MKHTGRHLITATSAGNRRRSTLDRTNMDTDADAYITPTSDTDDKNPCFRHILRTPLSSDTDARQRTAGERSYSCIRKLGGEAFASVCLRITPWSISSSASSSWASTASVACLSPHSSFRSDAFRFLVAARLCCSKRLTTHAGHAASLMNSSSALTASASSSIVHGSSSSVLNGRNNRRAIRAMRGA